MEQQSKEAIAALAKAIAVMRDGQPPKAEAIAPQWPTIGRAHIMKWLDDFARLLTRAERSIQEAGQAGPTEAGRDMYELGLWSLEAARERLVAIACLTMGVQLIELAANRRSVRFRVNPRLLDQRLQALTARYPAAGRLNDLGRHAAQHQGIDRRNEASHSISQVPEVAELIWLDRVDIRGGKEVAVASQSLYRSDRFLASGDLRPAAVWENAISDAGETLELVAQMAAALASLVVDAGELAPPVAVYWDVEKEQASLAAPQGGSQ
jgi:hypothetical protein